MNKKINLLWGFCISMLFFSCDPACYNSVSITVSNETDKKLIEDIKEFLIFVSEKGEE